MCVLLVEDETMIREIMAESLSEAGFEVHDVASGEEAVAAIEQPAKRYCALVTDFHMQGATNGADVAASIRRALPGIPVVIASGRPDVFEPGWRRDHGYALLRKPYLARELVALVRELVGSDRGTSGVTVSSR